MPGNPLRFWATAMRQRIEQLGGSVTVTTAVADPRLDGPTGNDDPGGGADVIRVLLVDDHPVVRIGLRGMLEAAGGVDVVAEAGAGEEAITVAARLRPDVILMDLRMPGVDGVTATERIMAADPRAKIVVLTTYETDTDILRAVEAGAAGYLLKDSPPADLVRAITAAAGARPCSPPRSPLA